MTHFRLKPDADRKERNPMKITYNVEGKNRKELANAIGKLLGMEPIYRKAPTFAYDIGGYVVDKMGVLTTPEEASDDDAFRLVDALFAEYGYQPEEPLQELFPEAEKPLEEAKEEPEAEAAEDEDDETDEDENSEGNDEEAKDEVASDEEDDSEKPLRVGAVLPTEVTEEDEATYATKVAQIQESDDAEEAPETPETAPEEPEAEAGEEADEAPETAPDEPETGDSPTETAEDAEAEEDAGEAGEEPAEDTADDDVENDDGADENTDEAPDRLTLSLPREKFSYEAVERLKAIISSKQSILKKVFETEDLTIIVNDSQILFPWFTLHGVDGEVDAYGKFIWAIARRALTASRISPYEKPTDNEKFTMRLFLNSLGFQGEEFKFARRFLIRNLEGNGAWRYGNGPSGNGIDLEPPTVFVPKSAVPEEAAAETMEGDSDDE